MLELKLVDDGQIADIHDALNISLSFPDIESQTRWHKQVDPLFLAQAKLTLREDVLTRLDKARQSTNGEYSRIVWALDDAIEELRRLAK